MTMQPKRFAAGLARERRQAAGNLGRGAWIPALLAGALLLASGTAKAETWTVTSLGWQPFSGPDLPQQGAGIHTLRKALETEGVELEVRFMPWKRAKAVAGNDDGVVGYYPSWPSEVIDGFFASETVFTSPVGFAEMKDSPISWDTPADLGSYTIATVGAYIYPDSFQKLIDDGTVETIAVDNDATALRMLGAGRVDAAAIDKFVMRYQLNTNPALKDIRDKVQFDDKVLIDYDLVVAFADTPANRDRAKTLEKALANVGNTERVIRNYLMSLR